MQATLLYLQSRVLQHHLYHCRFRSQVLVGFVLQHEHPSPLLGFCISISGQFSISRPSSENNQIPSILLAGFPVLALLVHAHLQHSRQPVEADDTAWSRNRG